MSSVSNSRDNYTNNNNIRIEIASPNDAQRISELINEAYFSLEGFRDPINGARTDIKLIESLLGSPNIILYVLKVVTLEGDAKKTDSIASTILYTKKSDTEASIGPFATSKGYRGQKIGKQLLDRVTIVAKESGIKKLTLGVAHINSKLMDYYESLGFKRDEEDFYLQDVLKPEWQGKDENGQWKLRAVTMIKTLD